MGVTSLWTILHPTARPIKIDTLAHKRLAVDASIWIYQFLKAVRDKEGNALRNSHVVGFFRRICKLLFFGIKPVFVFDGGAPALKRATIAGRKRRREGRREDAVRTAGKLLALQMQRVAEEEERKRKEEAGRGRGTARDQDEEEVLPENLVYVEELQMSAQERQQSRKFKKKDQYHLPELDVSLAEMGRPDDLRVMSLEELEQYARQFDTGEDIDVYDFSKIDFDSPFFVSLPASDRYNILNAARLRSRLRMGYSKDQLDTMFPDRMAFSKFQIERVRERNELTQRLMQVGVTGDDGTFGVNGTSRVAGEKGREYVLVKNDGVEGGWALGVVSNNKEEGGRSKPIDVEELERRRKLAQEAENEESEEEDEFEDIPIEGLNRLPKRTVATGQGAGGRDVAAKRRALYKSRKQNASGRPRAPKLTTETSDSLFVAEEEPEEEEWEDVAIEGVDDLFEEQPQDGDPEDEELQRAIAMSLEQDQPTPSAEPNPEAEDLDDYTEVFEQKRVEDSRPFFKGSGLAIAKMANMRSKKAAAELVVASDSEDDDMDLQAALVESRKSKYKPNSSKPRRPSSPPAPKRQEPAPAAPSLKPQAPPTQKADAFGGALPFEKLNLGSSLLGKKKMQKLTEDSAGGFEKDAPATSTKEATPLPPWFSEDMQQGMNAQKAIEAEERRKDRKAAEEEFQFIEQPTLRRHETCEVIDVDEPEPRKQDVIAVESSDDDQEVEDVVVLDPKIRMGDMADKLRADPPPKTNQPASAPIEEPVSVQPHPAQESDEELLEWEESDHEAPPPEKASTSVEPAGGRIQPAPTGAPFEESEDEFEDVPIPEASRQLQTAELAAPSHNAIQDDDGPIPMSGHVNQEAPLEDSNLEITFGDDQYSDPEDEALMLQLAAETEEHARFASILNNKPQAENLLDYERELKQLRSQQKRDRRDADEVTQTMITECQQLLSLFGLPYITAPMEAEAQCAALVDLGLVDGIVTDDSDTFLFGGTRVYKNMFNAAKFVECYLLSDISSELGLSREKLIAVAELLGSDYTDGLPGVGPVTALEILSEFDDLTAFREWWTAVQSATRKADEDKASPFRRKFRKSYATKLFLPPTFPDPRVRAAYLEPDVDTDPSPFVWGVPDLDALRRFLMATIGWSQERTDEVLVPVIKDMNRRETEGTQNNITQFFSGGVGVGARQGEAARGSGEAFAPRKRAEGKSKRLESALGRIAEKAKRRSGEGLDGGEVDGEVEAAGERESAPAPQSLPARANGKNGKNGKRAKPATPEEPSAEEDEAYAEPRKKAKKVRSTNAPGKRKGRAKASA
ncbi:DNA repair protein rad2 [Coniosporium apollinis]|uniref:DNA repair protein rad2 n=1 Tax=Coniosporium apollinis TaxID=61459 RepID=A0ABQ9NLA9_9PEZI|nr:DNA repair protein rad2 [Coniosporium apollinis]